MKKSMKILVITVPSWNSKIGANSWATLLEAYSPKNIASIYIRDEIPDCKVCSKYFNISENKIIKSLFDRRIKTGSEVLSRIDNGVIDINLQEHNRRYAKMKKKRKYSMLLAREFIWKMGKWRTQELDAFLDDFKPDIILHSMDGYIHLNRIIEYSIRRTKAKAIGYIWDDNFSYKQSSKVGYKIYRFFQRKSLKRLAKKTQAFFAITEKTKREADEFFGIDCQVLTKPLNAVPETWEYKEDKKPLRMLYTGNLLIGRDNTLEQLVKVLNRINKENPKIFLDVYTQTQFSKEKLETLTSPFCFIHAPITQSEILKKQKEADILLFLEDLSADNLTARLSFSTKITDYFSTGKCIFAIGNHDLAPIEYFEKNEAAIVCYNEEQIQTNIEKFLNDRSVLSRYAKNARECAIKNHNLELIRQRFEKQLEKVILEG